MKLTSYGAADGVTGSCHLIENQGSKVLLDCGMFQGDRDNRNRNGNGFEFDPSDIDAVIVSHAHIDHIGRLPLLFKAGFRGRIISTRATYELARLSLLDSASLQTNEAERLNRKRKLGTERIEPLYDHEDALDTLELWAEFLPYDEPCACLDGWELTFRDAGHILGSATINLTLTEGDEVRRFAFSGDLGNVNKPIIRDPAAGPSAQIILMESTYGDRDHRPFESTIKELVGVISETVRHGNVVIPTFALQRAQELLYVLYEAWRDGRIPEDVRIFLDSPMAISATRIFGRHPDEYDAEATLLRNGGEDPFNFPALNYTRETRDSMAINTVKRGAIILAGSGMVTGGRVLHHLRHNLSRPECAVVICGYQARGTAGRQIVDKHEFIKLHGETIPVHASVHTINGFSAHAGQVELSNWALETGAQHIFLAHGEDEAKVALATHLHRVTEARTISAMRFGEPVDLLKLEVD